MSALKKVLIVTYYWPPSGGSGVQRWLKMSKYLHQFGWQPVIYTAENGEFPAIDHSLVKDIHADTIVLKQPIWEPYTLYKKLTGKKKENRMGAGFLSEEKKSSRLESLSVWIRGNLFIPDARKFWIKPSINFLEKYLKENKVDAIISTGPPHSMHMIALGLKRKFNIPWVADFRDPWTKIDFYDQLRLSDFADRKHRNQETEIMQQADVVVSVSKTWETDFIQLGAKNTRVITNGFDHEDFQNLNVTLSDKFTITHIGSMNKDRNTPVLWKVLAQLSSEIKEFNENLKLQFIGKTDYAIFEDIKNHGLENRVRKVNYLSHKEVITEMAASQLLLLAINNTENVGGVIPGKLFEYMAVKRPIIAIGPPSADSGQIIHETKAGEIFAFEDFDKLKKAISDYYQLYLEKKLLPPEINSIDKYSRKSLAENYTHLLNELI